jgi:hypothetical protein
MPVACWPFEKGEEYGSRVLLVAEHVCEGLKGNYVSFIQISYSATSLEHNTCINLRVLVSPYLIF